MSNGGRLGRIDPELQAAAGFVGLAVVGWWLHSLPLAIIAALGALSAGVLFIWQRDCLTAVTYTRKLSAHRANFGEEVILELEIVNDKLLPVPWLEIEDEVPAGLPLRGGEVAIVDERWRTCLVNVLPVLPYQRVRRRVTIQCRERGEHAFGPATLESGDPIGYRSRRLRLAGADHLLVYPKLFTLAPAGVPSRALIGDVRASRHLLDDPSRVAGVRDYRPGDPLRSIDWRATARSTGLLVREFEPTVTLRVAVFVDFRVPATAVRAFDVSLLELTIAVAASVVADLAARKVAVGLYATGAVSRAPIAHPPVDSPAQLPVILEALARAETRPVGSFGGLLLDESSRLRRGTSILTVAANYSDATSEALAEVHRRHSVTAVWVAGERGGPPPAGQVDALWRVDHTDEWRDDEILELAS